MGTFDLAHGLGFMALGMTFIFIAGLIILKVVNTMEKNKKEEEQRKQMEKIYGSN